MKLKFEEVWNHKESIVKTLKVGSHFFLIGKKRLGSKKNKGKKIQQRKKIIGDIGIRKGILKKNTMSWSQYISIMTQIGKKVLGRYIL